MENSYMYNTAGQKYCSSCHVAKDKSEYTKSSGTFDGLDYYCKQCKKDKNSKYYKMKSGEWQAERKRKSKLANKLKLDQSRQIIQQAKECGCKICGEKSFCCLDFHHLNPEAKDYNVSELRNHLPEQLINEISKCIVLCANCHRKYHAGLLECPT